MKKVSLTSLFICLCLGCASYQTQIKNDSISTKEPQNKPPSHRILLLGNLEGKGGFDLGEILTLKTGIQTRSGDSSTVLFLENAFGRMEGQTHHSKKTLREQVSNYDDLLASSTGQVIFIPGKTEWEQGVDWIEALDNGLVDTFGKKSFLPKNGCPIASRKLGETAVLITIDSQWYLNDWDDFPKMNDQCEIKDRAKFLAEFESLVKKNTDKTLIVAMHHPVLSNGNHGGHYSFGQSLTPLPVVGSVKTAVQKMGGFSTGHLQNETYRSFRKQLMTLSKYNPRVLFVAAHEKNLQ